MILAEKLTLGCRQLGKLPINDIVFKSYNAFMMLNIYAKKNNWNLKENMQTNAQSTSYEEQNIITFEIFDDDKNLKHFARKFCSQKPRGRQIASLAILADMFGPDRNWMELVEETKNKVE